MQLLLERAVSIILWPLTQHFYPFITICMEDTITSFLPGRPRSHLFSSCTENADSQVAVMLNWAFSIYDCSVKTHGKISSGTFYFNYYFIHPLGKWEIQEVPSLGHLGCGSWSLLLSKPMKNGDKFGFNAIFSELEQSLNQTCPNLQPGGQVLPLISIHMTAPSRPLPQRSLRCGLRAGPKTHPQPCAAARRQRLCPGKRGFRKGTEWMLENQN